MVARVHHSIYLSGANPKDSPACAMSRVLEKSFHVLSASLPSRSHPIISEVEDGIAALRSWKSGAECGSLCTGLALIEQLRTSLDDLLRLPQSEESLCRRSTRTDRLVEDFLLPADAHGTFRSIVMTLKHHQSVVQTAIRRWDEASLISSAKSQRCTEKELGKLASVGRWWEVQLTSSQALKLTQEEEKKNEEHKRKYLVEHSN